MINSHKHIAPKKYSMLIWKGRNIKWRYHYHLLDRHRPYSDPIFTRADCCIFKGLNTSHYQSLIWHTKERELFKFVAAIDFSHSPQHMWGVADWNIANTVEHTMLASVYI